MQIKKQRPWLTSGGVEIATEQLKEITKGWDSATWEEYLSWYESACREKLIAPRIYQKLCDEQTESIFQRFNQTASADTKALCEKLLAQLPYVEQRTLRLYFLEGKTEREVAAALNLSQPGVHKMKNRALTNLRRGFQGDQVITRQYIGGSDSQILEDSIWDRPLLEPIREAKVYDPKKYKQELAEIKNKHLRIAMSELPDFEQRLLYLCFWCDFSFAELARELGVGANTVDTVCETAIAKLKTKMLSMEASAKGGFQCA